MHPNPQSPEVSIIGEMITPALLILASGSLIATVIARIGRIVDFVRKIADSSRPPDSKNGPFERRLLEILKRRAAFAESAIICYYVAVFCFVLTCLLIAVDRLLGHTIYLAPVLSAVIGVCLVLTGSGFMVAESRLAIFQLKSEINEITMID